MTVPTVHLASIQVVAQSAQAPLPLPLKIGIGIFLVVYFFAAMGYAINGRPDPSGVVFTFERFFLGRLLLAVARPWVVLAYLMGDNRRRWR